MEHLSSLISTEVDVSIVRSRHRSHELVSFQCNSHKLKISADYSSTFPSFVAPLHSPQSFDPFRLNIVGRFV